MGLLNAGRTFGLPLILGILIGAFFVVFALQNTMLATITVLSWHFTLPLALLATSALCLGAVGTIAAMVPGFIKNERFIRELKAGKKDAEDELAKYSIVIPLAPPDQTNSRIPVYVRPMPNLPR